MAKAAAESVSRLSVFRIAIFVIALSLIVYLANERLGWYVTAAAVVFIFIFGILVNRHNAFMRKYEYLKAIASVNRSEALRLGNDLKGFEEGAHYNTPNHPYASDLDIFGRYSVFQLLNRTTTPQGEQTLAAWLRTPADKDTVESRQEAVKELAGKTEWRQAFEATGKMNLSKKEGNLSLPNAEQPLTPISSWQKVWAAAAVVFSLPMYFLVFTAAISWHWIAVPLILNSFFLLALARSLSEDYKRLTGMARHLSVFVDLFEIIEKEVFESEALKRQKAELLSGSKSASEAFSSLSAIVNRFDNRSNMFYQLLNAFVLMDFWLVLAAQRWFSSHGHLISAWLAANANMETFNSLSGFAFANPAYCFPAVEASAFRLEARNLGHPLIGEKERVTNDFEVSGKALLLITGSNMSGKSTFLRTVGVNVVLGLAGAPVCATSMSLSFFQLFTSMRTHDALEESVSSFYAELRRIRQLLDLLETKVPVLYMLDEVLKGTNSDDRHKGTEALVHQLLKKNAAGFISTHDLSLSYLGERLPQVTNYSFNNFIEGDELIFDYKLTEGPCRSFNASQLMKNMGIEIIP